MNTEKTTRKRQLAEIILDKKSRLAINSYDLIDKHIRLIDEELNALDSAIADIDASSGLSLSNSNSNNSISITPQINKAVSIEPVFCVCRRIAFGEMIACDNEDCLIEWFHFPCVGLKKQRKKGELWYCPDCRISKSSAE